MYDLDIFEFLEHQQIPIKLREDSSISFERTLQHLAIVWVTYHIDFATWVDDLHYPTDVVDTWGGWLPVERPLGALLIDKQNPGVHGGRGSIMHHLVGLTRHKLNPKLLHYLCEHPADQLPQQPRPHYRRRVWRIRDRLSEQDVIRLLLAFKLGAPKYVLAEHYGLSMKSVKKLLRKHGVKKRSRYDRYPSRGKVMNCGSIKHHARLVL